MLITPARQCEDAKKKNGERERISKERGEGRRKRSYGSTVQAVQMKNTKQMRAAFDTPVVSLEKDCSSAERKGRGPSKVRTENNR